MSAKAHLEICLRALPQFIFSICNVVRISVQVGMRASLKGRAMVVAQFYDSVARKDYAERAFRGDSDFNPDTSCRSLDAEILARAEVQWDSHFKTKP